MAESGSALAERLDALLAHVLEASMREQVVRERLIEAGDDDAYALVRAALEPRRPASDPLRCAVHALLAEGARLPYALRRDLYAQAAEADDALVMRLLRSLPAKEQTTDTELRLPVELAEVPLGRRRSLAKGSDLHLLDQLALDSDPIVMRNLLHNPRIVERDVLRIAALRPVAATTLEEVAHCAHWASRPRIRVALARNPYCPVDLAISLVAALPLQELKTMRRDPDLHEQTLEQVEYELARRG